MSAKIIPVMVPVLGEEESLAVSRVLATGWITQGPEVRQFEQEFAEFVTGLSETGSTTAGATTAGATGGPAHACAVSNCTVALYLALRAVGVAAGDEVITVSHSFIATANAIRYLDALPVFADISPGSFNVDPQAIPALITPRTKAILCVHQLGMPCDLNAILAIARTAGLPVIEDAACAVGSEIQIGGVWEKIGKPHGDICCFSFHPRKLLTCGDGGMLTTCNPHYDQKFRLWRQHSMDLADTTRHASAQVVFESYTELGFNFRLTDLQAAVAREIQLRRLPGCLEHRRRQVQCYKQQLSGIAGLQIPTEPSWARSNWQSFCIGLPAHVDQRRCLQKGLDRGISARRGVMCAHREPAYAKEPWSSSPDGLPNSEFAQDQSIILPLYHALSTADQDRVIAWVAEACSETAPESAGKR